VCPIEAPGELIAKVLTEWNDLVSSSSMNYEIAYVGIRGIKGGNFG
jgi:hypothetical protein